MISNHRPYFAKFNVLFNSTANYFTSTEVPGTRQYTLGLPAELYDTPRNFTIRDPRKVSSRFLSLVPGLQGAAEAFVGSNNIQRLVPDFNNMPSSANDSTITPNNVYISGTNGAVVAMGDYLLKLRNDSDVTLADIEIFVSMLRHAS